LEIPKNNPGDPGTPGVEVLSLEILAKFIAVYAAANYLVSTTISKTIGSSFTP
jgi:hypothetical protein